MNSEHRAMLLWEVPATDLSVKGSWPMHDLFAPFEKNLARVPTTNAFFS